MDDYWQQVANFVFNVSNLLFSQVLTQQTQTSSGNVENIYSPGLDRLCTIIFLTLRRPCLGFDPYFVNHWVRSTKQPCVKQRRQEILNFGAVPW